MEEEAKKLAAYAASLYTIYAASFYSEDVLRQHLEKARESGLINKDEEIAIRAIINCIDRARITEEGRNLSIYELAKRCMISEKIQPLFKVK